jgi:hypothetical protein
VTRATWLGTDCDEQVGRICLRYDEGGDWWPSAEDPRIVAARHELLGTLAEAAGVRPDDRWILGQRVHYLAESGAWSDAEALARPCVQDDPEWCGALLGLALHGQGRTIESERAFRDALASMEDAERRRWLDPAVVLDGAARGYLDDLADSGPERWAEGMERVWRLSDPLYLVDGNDRLAEHWSRLTVARLRQGVTNPYGLRWGRDLEEVLVRYGWEVGWDRVLDFTGALGTGVVGHHHPESRVYIPPGDVLRDPAGSAKEGWRLSPARPRDGYAPAYAPVILPADGEVLRFPRGDRLVVVAAFGVPEDTAHHGPHGHPPFAPPERYRGAAAQAGFFLVPLAGGSTLEVRRDGAAPGALLLEAAAASYVASTEIWVPERGFAGRVRHGVRGLPLPLDVPTLSDLVLLERALPDSVPLELAVREIRAAGVVSPGDTLAVGWEIHGLGWRSDELSYRLSVFRTDVGFFNRLGDWLGISEPAAPLRLSWEEPGPDRPGPRFRTVTLQIPPLERGEYVLRLELSTDAGATLASERALRVAPR